MNQSNCYEPVLKEKFLRRLLLYRLQYLIALFLSFLSYPVYIYIISTIYNWEKFSEIYGFLLPFFMVAIFNTVTYLYSKYLAKKYGINMFDDLEQEWLKEYQGFDSKAFGEIFSRLIQCRKIAGPYLMLTLITLTIIHINLAFIIGIVYVIGYFIYRNTYLNAAIADRVPRAFGGGIIISRIMDSKFDHKYNKSIAEKKNVK